MATLLELQELFRNISDPEVEDLLRSGPPDTKWMVMDEKRRRGEMREAAKAMQSESQMKPRNMLEEYQASASSILGGQPPGDNRMGLSQDPGISSGQEDFMQSDMTQPSGNPDFYGDQSGDVQGYAFGGPVIPMAVGALGRKAAASSIPWLAALAQRFGAKAVTQVPKVASGAAKLPPGWTIGPRGIPMPPRGGVPGPSGRLSPPHPGDPTITTPMGQIPGRGVNLPQGRGAGAGRPAASSPGATTVPGGATDTAGEAVKKGFIRRHPYLTGGAALLGANYMMGDEDEQDSAGVLENARQVDPNAPQGTGQYLELLSRIMDRDDELRERIGDSRISTRDQIRRVGLRAFGAMASTPGGFGRGLGAAFDAASQELGAISAEESDMLRNAINEYQVGSRSVVDLISVIADINKSMQASGRGGMTLNGMVKLLEQYDFNDIPGVLAKARSLMGSELYAANQPQTDYDHSTLGSAYGTD
jgi:hypothetical protein